MKNFLWRIVTTTAWIVLIVLIWAYLVLLLLLVFHSELILK